MGVGVGVAIARVIVTAQFGLIPAAWGWLSGTLGATFTCLNWKSLMAVKTAIPARTKVANTTIIVAAFPLNKSFIFYK